ncbi:MAG: phosphoribosyltransferase family protein [Xenococcaceae cyanobacterium MO_188.B32]|nr:phosphoribosyltransferase family protein [Xenococcaceae cyanobacterium MO_188.B32]
MLVFVSSILYRKVMLPSLLKHNHLSYKYNLCQDKEGLMTLSILFRDRPDAGRQLAKLVSLHKKQFESSKIDTPLIVYALPRGGIPIALPIARELGCPLDIIVAKKITTPDNPELAIGAVTSKGNLMWTKPHLLRKISWRGLKEAMEDAQQKAREREAQLSLYRPKVNPQGSIAIIVDDGIATGMTMAVAAQEIKDKQVKEVWICAPVAPPDLVPKLELWSDRVLLLATPYPFLSVSRFYQKFAQVSLEEVITILQQYNQPSRVMSYE